MELMRLGLVAMLAAGLVGCGKRTGPRTVSPVAIRQQVAVVAGELEVAKAAVQPTLDQLEDLNNAITASPFPAPVLLEECRAGAEGIRTQLSGLGESVESIRQRAAALPDRPGAALVTPIQGELDAAAAGIKNVEPSTQALRERVAALDRFWSDHRVEEGRDNAESIRAKAEELRLANEAVQKKERAETEAREKKAAAEAEQQIQQFRALHPHEDDVKKR